MILRRTSIYAGFGQICGCIFIVVNQKEVGAANACLEPHKYWGYEDRI